MLAMGAFVDTMEVASPWSKLLPMYRAVHHALAPHVFVMAHFSHAYPDGGSIYFTFAGAAADDDAALAKYDAAWRDALRAVVDAGGTLSHHHGVGRSKAPAMRREQGAAIDVVRTLKSVLDPRSILNPGALIGGGDDAR
jgi:alkyldihydroxyacetonephosphate synthase